MATLPVSGRQGIELAPEQPVKTTSPSVSTFSTQPSLHFTPRGTVGEWYDDECDFAKGGDPGPSSSTYGKYLRQALNHTVFDNARRLAFRISPMQVLTYGKPVGAPG